MKVVAVPTVLPELIITLTPHLLENNTLSASSFILRRPSIPHGSITFFAVSILLSLVVHYQILSKIFCPVELSRLKSAPLSGQVTHHEGVFSCTFYALAISGLSSCMPPAIDTSLYMDDFAMFTYSVHLPAAERRIQLALNLAFNWSQRHDFKFSPSKTVSMYFTPYLMELPSLCGTMFSNTRTGLLSETLRAKFIEHSLVHESAIPVYTDGSKCATGVGFATVFPHKVIAIWQFLSHTSSLNCINPFFLYVTWPYFVATVVRILLQLGQLSIAMYLICAGCPYVAHLC